MTDRQMSITAGKEPNRLATIRYQSPKIYKEIKKHGGIDQLHQEYLNRCTKIGKIYYAIDTTPSLRLIDFYRLYFKDDYVSTSSFSTSLSQMAFDNQVKLPSIKRFKMSQKIIDKYQNYLDHTINQLTKLKDE